MLELGVAFGRFQMLHLGHIEYLLAAKKQCEHLVIGVSNPDPELTKYEDACPHRSQKLANPLTFYERLKMIEAAMTEYGLRKEEFTIVPFPINFPGKIKYYIPDHASFLITIYDEWGWERKKILEKLGYPCSVLWVRKDASRISSGTEIRNKIIQHECWEQLVPHSVYQFVLANHIDDKIRAMET